MIIPAIIPKSLSELRESLDAVSFAPRVQLDLVDGQFVPFVSWPYEPHGTLSELGDLLRHRFIEVDLMVKDPLTAAEAWLKQGAQALIFHIETLTELLPALELKNKFDFELGLSLNNDTALEKILPWVDKIDFVQFMGIALIGQQGQPFDSRVISSIKSLRELDPEIKISVDGAVDNNTLPILKEAGVDRFAVGSAIFNSPDLQKAYAELLKIASS